jgi:hypothetical protein
MQRYWTATVLRQDDLVLLRPAEERLDELDTGLNRGETIELTITPTESTD